MSPEEIKLISGVLTAIGFMVLLRQIQWQKRVGLFDRQAVSAFLFLALTTFIVGQLALSYLGIVTFGNTERGPIVYLLWLGAVIWWGICTERHNGPTWRRMKDATKRVREAERKLRKPLQ